MLERIIQINLDKKQINDYLTVKEELNKSLINNGVIVDLEKNILAWICQ